MSIKSTTDTSSLIEQYKSVTKVHKNTLKSLIKCGMSLEQQQQSEDNSNENDLTGKEIINQQDIPTGNLDLVSPTSTSKWTQFEDYIHKLHQQNHHMRYLFIKLWSQDIVAYQKLLQYEMTMLENTKIQFTHNFFNRYQLQQCNQVIVIYRKILEVFFITETALICGQNEPMHNNNNNNTTNTNSDHLNDKKENLFDYNNDFKNDHTNNQDVVSRLKNQILTNINEIRGMSEQLENSTQNKNKKILLSIHKQQNMIIDEDNESIESIDRNFNSQADSMDMPLCVENFIENIKSFQSVPVSAKITGYRLLTIDNSSFNQFCVKIKIKHAFYEIWRRYNSFRKLHHDLSVISPIVNNCFFPQKLTNISNDCLLKYRRLVLEEYLNAILNYAFDGKIGKFIFARNNRNGGPNLNLLHPFFDPQAQDHNLI